MKPVPFLAVLSLAAGLTAFGVVRAETPAASTAPSAVTQSSTKPAKSARHHSTRHGKSTEKTGSAAVTPGTSSHGATGTKAKASPKKSSRHHATATQPATGTPAAPGSANR